jgi:ADP-ribosylglycohydrolase
MLADSSDFRDRCSGLLLGTALGDALGLPFEGASAAVIARRGARFETFALLGGRGFVSDDTEQTALLARCIAQHPEDLDAARRAWRASMLAWFVRLPWGIGFGTLVACLRIALGFRRSAARSAGNGAAMRSAVIGAFFCDAPETRRRWSDVLAEVTHVDRRAVEGARYVAELAALCVRAGRHDERERLVIAASSVLEEPSLLEAISRARRLAASHLDAGDAARVLGCSGFVVHSLGMATFCFLTRGADPLAALEEVVRAGGDTDSNAAIVGAWVGALHGEGRLPPALLEALHDADWCSCRRRPTLAGPTHLRALADCLAAARGGRKREGGDYSRLGAFLRNLLLLPVALWYGFRVALRL